jgi:hypothetical protein
VLGVENFNAGMIACQHRRQFIYWSDKNMMAPDEIRAALRDRNLQKVAEGSKVSAATIYRFMNTASRPAYDTVKALSDYLEGKHDQPA